jgi:hypothetical protein
MGRIGYLDTDQLSAALSLGSAATASTGTSGAAVPLLSTANTWSLKQTFGPVQCSDLTATGTVSFFPAASVTPTTNGQMTFELTSNTTLTIRVKGSDGTVRSAALTLA